MFLLINKPRGITSHDVISKIRKITDTKKVGHAGTLDPLATGLLVVGIGRESTKKLGKISKGTKKNYLAEIFLGEERDTDDVEGKIISKSEKFPIPDETSIEETLKNFEGEQEQIPPIYSAIKIKGRKSYELARKGKEISLKKRKVVIYSIELLEYEFPILKIETVVSSGTYIRALARDIGKKLGCGGYLKNLQRTKIGKFDLKGAVDLEKLTKENWKDFVIEIN